MENAVKVKRTLFFSFTFALHRCLGAESNVPFSCEVVPECHTVCDRASRTHSSYCPGTCFTLREHILKRGLVQSAYLFLVGHVVKKVKNTF